MDFDKLVGAIESIAALGIHYATETSPVSAHWTTVLDALGDLLKSAAVQHQDNPASQKNAPQE